MNDLTYVFKLCGIALNILLSCEIGFYNLANRRDRLKGLKRVQNQPPTIVKISIGFFLFFLFSAFSFVFYILEMRWWYVIPGSNNIFMGLNQLKIICLIYAFSCLFLIINSILLKFKLKVPVLILLLIFPFLLIAPFWILNILVLCAVILCVLPLIMLYSLVAITKGKLRLQFLCILIGFILFLGGCIMITNLLDPFVHFIEYPISEPIISMGLIFMGYGFISMPSLNEAFTAAFVEELYLTTSKGNIILRYQYKAEKNQIADKDQAKMEEDFLGSSIVGIDSLLREISSAQGLLKTLVHQNKVLIVERASDIVGVFVTRMDLHTLRSQLGDFLHEVETKFLKEIQEQENLSDPSKAILNSKGGDWFKQELDKLGKVAKILFNSIQREIFDTKNTEISQRNTR